jgi:hypothetical protein
MFDLGAYFGGVLKKFSSNVMSPLLWLNALVSIPCLLGSFLTNDGALRYFFFFLAVIILGYSLLKYEFWSKKDPRLLMSESTQIELTKLDIIQEKGGEIKFDVIDIPLGEDPKRLVSGDEGIRHE